MSQSFVEQFSQRIDALNQKEVLPRYFKAPIFGLWELTNKCNLSCVHCYYNANSKEAKELSTAEALNIADELGKLGVFEVYISGGEPLLCNDWDQIIAKLREYDIQIGMITNGTYIDEAAAEKIARLKVKWVQISIDGSKAEIHDKARGLAGSWEKSIAAIKHLKKRGVRVHVSFVPSSVNYFDVGNVIELCASLGLDYFVTDMLVLTGKAALNFSSVTLGEKEYKEFFSALDKAAKKFSDKMRIIAPSPEKQVLKTYLSVRSATPNIWCIITPQGALRLDLLLPFTYGNLRKQTIKEIWQEYLKEGWQRPEVRSFAQKYDQMKDLIEERTIPYVTDDIHYE